MNEWGTELRGPRGVVQIAHGMSEHGGRYAEFADYLTGEGFVVVAPNHPGHGPAADLLGHFADADGWDVAVEHLHTVRLEMQARFPGVPYFFLGHSMGSMLTRDYVSRWGDGLSGAIIMGTAMWPGPLGEALLALAKGLSKNAPLAPGTLLHKVVFSTNNLGFEGRTPMDWLTCDASVVDAYIADPYSGYVPTNRFFVDLFTGLKRVSRDEVLGRTPSELPLLLTSGGDDPVGGDRAVHALGAQYRRLGHTSITEQVWPKKRHEILNEVGRDAVYRSILAWLERYVG